MKKEKKSNQEPKPKEQPKLTLIQIKDDSKFEREMCIKNLSHQ